MKAADLFALFADEGDELHIHLNAIGWRMFVIAPCVDFAQSRSMCRQTNAVTPQDTRSPRAKERASPVRLKRIHLHRSEPGRAFLNGLRL